MGNTTSNKFNESHKGGGEADKKKSPAKKQEGEKNKKVLSQDAAQGGGWFGGIFSKLSMKPKNQMILPDDKNPTVSSVLLSIMFRNLFDFDCRFYGTTQRRNGSTRMAKELRLKVLSRHRRWAT